MQQRQREILRAVRTRAQADAVTARDDARAALAAAQTRYVDLEAAAARAARPPAVGDCVTADAERRRRAHLQHIEAQRAAAWAELSAARARLAAAQAELVARVGAVRAVEVLDDRAATAARRAEARREAEEAAERNQRDG